MFLFPLIDRLRAVHTVMDLEAPAGPCCHIGLITRATGQTMLTGDSRSPCTLLPNGAYPELRRSSFTYAPLWFRHLKPVEFR
jgi:hypothetical protein